MRRRAVAGAIALALVAGGVFVVVRRTGGDAPIAIIDHPQPATTAAAAPAQDAATTTGKKKKRKAVVVKLGRIPAAEPGTPEVVDAGAAGRRQVALTFDDGYCAECVRDLVRAVERSGAHVTFCPNGAYASAWEPQRRVIRRMLASGQVTLCNHTFTHADLRTLDAAGIRQELERNESWIEETFGVTSRPWFRPPYGSYDDEVLQVAGELGFTRIAMWSGTVADSSPRTEDYIVEAVRAWAKPGAIILGHGNYPATPAAFDRILKVLDGRNLKTATLPEIVAP